LGQESPFLLEQRESLPHNRPSGDLTPSQVDIQMTKAIVDSQNRSGLRWMTTSSSAKMAIRV